MSGLDFADDTRTFAVTDFDGDGVPDLVLKNRLGPQIRAMQNDCSGGRSAIAISLRGTKSNRDAIGARVEVNGQVQYLSAGSGFLSQHSKKLHFGLAGQTAGSREDHLAVGGGAGGERSRTGLRVHHRGRFERSGRAQPFRARRALPASVLRGKNDPQFGDTWLLEPVPTPDRGRPRARRDSSCCTQASVRRCRPACPSEWIDLKIEKDDVAASYSLFRRYLFEYRADLSLPLVLLVDDGEPGSQGLRGYPLGRRDARAIWRASARAMRLRCPFPGKYYLNPRRNYFKLGAAFYWAGYPDRALPYLAETLRARPDNWKALQAMARIQLELGRNKEALASFQQVIALKSDYPPAFVGAGEAYAKQDDRANAQRMFQRALDLDPKCADAMNQLGLLAAGANDLPGARQWFQQAMEAQAGSSGRDQQPGRALCEAGPAQRCHRRFPVRHQDESGRRRAVSESGANLRYDGPTGQGSRRAERIAGTEAGKRDGDQGAGGIGGEMIDVIVLLIEAIALSGRVVNISEPPSERLSPPAADRAGSAAGVELPLFRCQRPGPLRQSGADDGRCGALVAVSRCDPAPAARRQARRPIARALRCAFFIRCGPAPRSD